MDRRDTLAGAGATLTRGNTTAYDQAEAHCGHAVTASRLALNRGISGQTGPASAIPVGNRARFPTQYGPGAKMSLSSVHVTLLFTISVVRFLSVFLVSDVRPSCCCFK